MPIRILKNSLLFDCTGETPADNGWVAVEGETIREIGTGTPPVFPGAEVLDCRGLTVLPGLIDAHIHLSLFDNDFCELHRRDYPAMHYVKALGVLKDTLDQGFTTARDAGGADPGFREAVRRRLVPGPDLAVCGRVLCQTGGHADQRYSTEICPPAWSPFTAVIADGVPEVIRAAREQLRQGVDHLKLMACGGCASQADEPDTTQFTPEEVQAVVYEAAAVGKRVLAHCYSNRSMRLCAQAGVYSIEHGNYLDQETAAILKKQGCWLVPTLSTYFYLCDHGEEIGLASFFLRKMKQVRESALDAVRVADKAGIPLGSGSDMVGSGQPYKNLEIGLKARAIGPIKAILSATRENARLMGREGEIGTLESGKRADLLVVAGNPLEHPDAFADRDNIKVIIQRGEVYKNTL